jgi:hypothetical protein
VVCLLPFDRILSQVYNCYFFSRLSRLCKVPAGSDFVLYYVMVIMIRKTGQS